MNEKPMTDIVERLRRAERDFWAHERLGLVVEAAAEIERLRAALKEALEGPDL